MMNCWQSEPEANPSFKEYNTAAQTHGKAAQGQIE